MIFLAFLAQTLRIAIPYVFAAIGGVVSERSGLIALGLEGYMLGGAFCGALASYYSGSPWIGLLGAAAARRRARAALRGHGDSLPRRSGGGRHRDQSVGHRADEVSAPPRVPQLGELAARSGIRRRAVWRSDSRRSSGIRSSCSAFLRWRSSRGCLYRTPFGLRVRAVGEHPAAATSVGIRVSREFGTARRRCPGCSPDWAARTSRSTNTCSAPR